MGGGQCPDDRRYRFLFLDFTISAVFCSGLYRGTCSRDNKGPLRSLPNNSYRQGFIIAAVLLQDHELPDT